MPPFDGWVGSAVTDEVIHIGCLTQLTPFSCCFSFGRAPPPFLSQGSDDLGMSRTLSNATPLFDTIPAGTIAAMEANGELDGDHDPATNPVTAAFASSRDDGDGGSGDGGGGGDGGGDGGGSGSDGGGDHTRHGSHDPPQQSQPRPVVDVRARWDSPRTTPVGTPTPGSRNVSPVRRRPVSAQLRCAHLRGCVGVCVCVCVCACVRVCVPVLRSCCTRVIGMCALRVWGCCRF